MKNIILSIISDVTEMHQMFVDIATLVGAQGDLLDQIQFSVDSAKDYAGNTFVYHFQFLYKTLLYNRKRTKRNRCCSRNANSCETCTF
jgi:t-SNARE complex subunit (syntaxin)